jgi:hypothetical protein
MDHDVETSDVASSDKPQFRHWQSLGDGIIVSLVIVGPTFLFEELWRGRPLIDRGGFLWVLPAAIMGIGFLIGGIIAGRHRRQRKGSFNQGVLAAAVTLFLIFIADMIRRAVLGEAVTIPVLGIWCAWAAGALIVGGLGGLNGRHRTLQARKRRQMDAFRLQ